MDALAYLCAKMQYLPLLANTLAVIYHYGHRGHYEDANTWLLHVKEENHGDGEFVVVTGSRGTWRGVTFHETHSTRDASEEIGCLGVAGQYRTFAGAVECLLWMLPEEARAKAAETCSLWPSRIGETP